MQDFDVAVIGCGISGLAAAKTAREKGLSCVLIGKDFGATQHFSGAFDFIDPRLSCPHLLPADYPSVPQALDDFILRCPQHLYARLARGHADFSKSLVAAAADFFSYYQIPVMSDSKMLAAFASSGRIKPTAFALKTQALRVEEINRFKSALFVEIPFLAEYSSYSIVNELKRYVPQVSNMVWQNGPQNRTSPLAAYLTWMEDEKNFESLKIFLLANKGKCDVIFLPPILSVKKYLSYHERLEKECGVRVIELLSVLPSASGLRLVAHVQAAIQKSGLELVCGAVCEFKQVENKISELTIKEKNNSIKKIGARQVILASGKYLGGGIASQDGFRETLFDLPIMAHGRRVSPHQHITQLIDAKAVRPQDFLDVGLVINASQVPVDFDRAVFENLKACGQVLSGFDFTRERCGFGVSLASGIGVFNP